MLGTLCSVPPQKAKENTNRDKHANNKKKHAGTNMYWDKNANHGHKHTGTTMHRDKYAHHQDSDSGSDGEDNNQNTEPVNLLFMAIGHYHKLVNKAPAEIGSTKS